MDNLQSKFCLKQVIIIPTIIILIIGFMIAIIVFVSFELVKAGTALYKTPIWAILLFGLLLLYSFYYYFKIFKRFEFCERGIHISNVFGKQFYSWKVIRDIRVVGKEYEIFLWQYLVEDATSIQLNNGEVVVLFSKYYQNMPEIRKYLQIVNSHVGNRNEIKLSTFKKEKTNTRGGIEVNNSYIQFKGNHFLTLNGFLVYFFGFLGAFMIFHSYSSMTLIGFLFLIGLPVLYVLGISFQFYYFELENKYLVIKNHLPFFKSKKYKFSDIKSIFIEMDFKKSHKMRIITNDFKSKAFMANSLRDKHWKSLIEILKEKEVEVIDELFFE